MSVNTKGMGGEGGGVFVAAVWFILFFLYLKHILEAFYLSDCLFISLRILTKLFKCIFFLQNEKKVTFILKYLLKKSISPSVFLKCL